MWTCPRAESVETWGFPSLVLPSPPKTLLHSIPASLVTPLLLQAQAYSLQVEKLAMGGFFPCLLLTGLVSEKLTWPWVQQTVSGSQIQNEDCVVPVLQRFLQKESHESTNTKFYQVDH